MSTVVSEPGAEVPPPPAEPAPAPAAAPAAAPGPTCPNCGAAMAPGQEWCLECGVGAPGSFGSRPGWQSAAAIIGATVLLVAGAVAASYAALNRSSKHVVTRPATIAQVPTAPDAVTPPAGATPAAPKPVIPPVKPTPTPTPTPGHSAVTPPAAVPHPATPVPAPATPTPTPTPTPAPAPTPTHTTSTPQHNAVSPNSAAGTSGSQVVLDPDAAQIYNPYGAPASRFGDPSLAIDGDPTTKWTAQVDPAAAPRNASGLVLDLKAKQSLSRMKLHTSTPGMEFEVYGAVGDQPPPSITDPAWRHLTAPHAATRNDVLRLLTGGKKYRFIVVWLTKAQSASTTAKMALNEITLYH